MPAGNATRRDQLLIPFPRVKRVAQGMKVFRTTSQQKRKHAGLLHTKLFTNIKQSQISVECLVESFGKMMTMVSFLAHATPQPQLPTAALQRGGYCALNLYSNSTRCVCGGPCIRWGKCGKPRGKSFVPPENSCQVVWATIVLMRLQFLSFSFNLTMSQSLRLARARCKSDRQRKEMKRKSNGNGSSFACSPSSPLGLNHYDTVPAFIEAKWKWYKYGWQLWRDRRELLIPTAVLHSQIKQNRWEE